MKTNSFLFLFMLIAASVNAQLNLNHFSPGPVKRYLGVTIEPTIPVGGQNQTWDFSNLNPSGEQFDVQYVTPKPFITSSFPEANLAMKVSDDTSQTFFVIKKDANGMDQLGLVASVNGESSQTFFSNPKKMLTSSFSFGQEASDSYKSLLDLSNSGFSFKIINEGNVDLKIDANGTLILPDGSTITNVTRIRTRDRSLDTVSLEIPGFPSDPEVTENRNWIYTWYKNDGSGNPLLFSMSIDSAFTQGDWSVSSSAFYFQNSTTSNEDLVQSKLDIPYPTRVENVLTIPFSDPKNAPSSITLIDGLGRVVLQKEVKSEYLADHKMELSLSHLPQGIYHIVIPGKMNEKKKPISIIKL
jgi:hypothetical protein